MLTRTGGSSLPPRRAVPSLCAKGSLSPASIDLATGDVAFEAEAEAHAHDERVIGSEAATSATQDAAASLGAAAVTASEARGSAGGMRATDDKVEVEVRRRLFFARRRWWWLRVLL